LAEVGATKVMAITLTRTEAVALLRADPSRAFRLLPDNPQSAIRNPKSREAVANG
jgi:hypothetical protein